MPHTIESVLDNPAIERPRQLVSEFQFSLQGIVADVKIRIYRELNSSKFVFEQSHFIKVGLIAPYKPNLAAFASEAAALNQAVQSLMMHYEPAVQAGREPRDEWLVPNQFFS